MVPICLRNDRCVVSQVAVSQRKHALWARLLLVPAFCHARRVAGCPARVTVRGQLVTMASMSLLMVGSYPVGAFWDLIDEHLGRMEFPPSKRRLAERLNVAPQTITNWQAGLNELPKRENLEAVASFVGRSYGEVLNAALSDTGYARGSGLSARRRSKSPPADEAG